MMGIIGILTGKFVSLHGFSQLLFNGVTDFRRTVKSPG